MNTDYFHLNVTKVRNDSFINATKYDNLTSDGYINMIIQKIQTVRDDIRRKVEIVCSNEPDKFHPLYIKFCTYYFAHPIIRWIYTEISNSLKMDTRYARIGGTISESGISSQPSTHSSTKTNKADSLAIHISVAMNENFDHMNEHYNVNTDFPKGETPDENFFIFHNINYQFNTFRNPKIYTDRRWANKLGLKSPANDGEALEVFKNNILIKLTGYTDKVLLERISLEKELLKMSNGTEEYKVEVTQTNIEKAPTQPDISQENKHNYLFIIDTIEILGTIDTQKRYEIMINEKDANMSPKLFELFLRFVVELKKNMGGWIKREDLLKENYLKDESDYRPLSNLRAHIKGYINSKAAHDILENNPTEKNQYRLSIHPKNIKCNADELKKYPSNKIKRLAIQLFHIENKTPQ